MPRDRTAFLGNGGGRKRVGVKYILESSLLVSRLVCLFSSLDRNRMSQAATMLARIYACTHDEMGLFHNLRASPAQYRYYSDNVLLGKTYLYAAFLVFSQRTDSFSYSQHSIIAREGIKCFSSLRPPNIFLIISEIQLNHRNGNLFSILLRKKDLYLCLFLFLETHRG